jgi:hypothetical protein
LSAASCLRRQPSKEKRECASEVAGVERRVGASMNGLEIKWAKPSAV